MPPMVRDGSLLARVQVRFNQLAQTDLRTLKCFACSYGGHGKTPADFGVVHILDDPPFENLLVALPQAAKRVPDQPREAILATFVIRGRCVLNILHFLCVNAPSPLLRLLPLPIQVDVERHLRAPCPKTPLATFLEEFNMAHDTFDRSPSQRICVRRLHASRKKETAKQNTEISEELREFRPVRVPCSQNVKAIFEALPDRRTHRFRCPLRFRQRGQAVEPSPTRICPSQGEGRDLVRGLANESFAV